MEVENIDSIQIEPLAPCDPNDSSKPAPFNFVTENEYITERITSKESKRNKRMLCDCQFDPETDEPSDACNEDCLNRLLMIECGSRCPCGEYCNNKRFQRAQYKDVEVFKTDMKGWGLRCFSAIPKDSFVMEYCGEVCTPEEFEIRRKNYELDKRRHYYFMSLKTDEIIDATRKGNLSRYINHSCDPNCETQKWTVNGKLRVGFFAVKSISSGEELTFDYQFQRFGEEAQLCYCGSDNCRGYLGVNKDPPKDMGGVESRAKRTKNKLDPDSVFEREVYDIVGGGWRLKHEDQVLSLSRLMLRAESFKQRIMILKVIQTTSDVTILKRFLSFHGLKLIWSWMVELSDLTSSGALELKRDVILTLVHLPILNRNMVNDSKVLQVVKKWSEPKPRPQSVTEEPRIVISEADCSGDITEGGTRGTSPQPEEDKLTTHPPYTTPSPDTTPPPVATHPPDATPSPDATPPPDTSPVEETSEEKDVEECDGCHDNDNFEADVNNDDKFEGDIVMATDREENTANDVANAELVGVANAELVGVASAELVGVANTESEGVANTESEGVANAELVGVASAELVSVASTKSEGVTSAELVGVANVELAGVANAELVGVVSAELVGVSSEAEARQSNDTGNNESLEDSLASEIISMSVSLVEKWEQLEEVFKIPKKINKPSIAAVSIKDVYKRDKPNEGAESSDGNERKKFRKGPSRWDTPKDTPTFLRSREVGKRFTPATPPSFQSPTHAYPRPSLMGPSPSHPPPIPPLHNTVTIVQQPAGGQSLYVQQQIFTPSSYIPPVTMTTRVEPFLAVQPPMVATLQAPPTTQSSLVPPLFPLLPNPTHSSVAMGQLAPLPPPPPLSSGDLPKDWKSAKDSTGRVYYYHVVTRETQWVRPLPKDGDDIMMDLETPEGSPRQEESGRGQDHSSVGHPRTPDESPPPSIDSGSSPEWLESLSATPTADIASGRPVKHRKKTSTPREQFKQSLSKLIVRCLDHHRKPNCKYGRITCSEDFKHLARKLTCGLIEKEVSRKGVSSELVFTESVKSRVKDYVRSYMKKFGPIYTRPAR